MKNTAFKVFHRGKYFISIKRGFEEAKKDITITVEKLFENDSLRLILSDEEDSTFLYRILLTRCDYEELKKQQGLLIDFDNFPSQVVRLLQQCASNSMFLILQLVTPILYNFEVVEHNEFKRLVHLSLKTQPANDTELKQHMADTIVELKKTLMTLKSSSSSNEMMWSEKCTKLESKLHDLSLNLTKIEEEKLRHEIEYKENLKLEKDRLVQEKIQWQKQNEAHTNNLLAASQDNLNRKDKHIEEQNHKIKQLRDKISQIENQLSEKINRSNYLEKELQRIHIEVSTLSSRNSTLEREVVDKEKLINQMNSNCTYLEKTVKDNTNVIKELNENIQALKNEKSNLERRLSLSESLANKNTEAAQSTTEQLLKANQIITKQNNDLLEIKDKLLCRTAIALEQEKVIEGNIKEIEELKIKIKSSSEEIEKIKSELDAFREMYNKNEEALKDRDETIKNNNMVIQWLHKKLEGNGMGRNDHPHKSSSDFQSATSTPYFLQKNVQNCSQETDESINFYATSKLSSVEDSPKPSAPNKKGLDPKYLKPATEGNRIQKKDCSREAANVQSKSGKENKHVDLPKVDFREKKSSRPTTYRATPVSAYFP
ncbi:spindle assembly abnormal protein 6 homolog [Danaus plexippus]|uniref:spindle assembly abnormal protein 6 homolog n=1 Tax=Danaus plexippus TaxID=13037 RepID=UPI002AB0D8DF|nr:spindle assembly abnormal protein 6 homolog [Danaus plexippus]